MKYSTKAARLVILLMLSAVVFAVVGGVAAQDSIKTLITGRQMGPDDIPTLDPSLMQDVNSVQVGSEFFPGLANLDEEKVTVGPGIASSWDVSADGMTYTFHLMDNVPWVHYNADSGAVEEIKDDAGNVMMVTAQDFAYAIQRTLDPKTAGPYQGVLAPWIVGGAEFVASDPDASDADRQTLIDALGIKVIDDHTLAITEPLPSSVFPVIATMWVTWAEPQAVIEANGEFWTDPENIATYGPFTMKDWQHGGGGSLTMIKNPFWPGTPNSPVSKIDEVQFVFLDQDPQLANFEAGSLDVSEVPQDAVDRIKADATLSQAYFVGPGTCTYYYGFGSLEAPFDDPSVRLAFSEAIDRQSIVENITKAGQIPASYLSLPSLVAAPTEAEYPGGGVYTNIDDAKARWEA
ncbi:MAG: ABC transporter substrate-binding protein, partial [Chloroflexota bacterium]